MYNTNLQFSAGYWVYPFLDWKQGPITALYYFIVAVVVVLAFFAQVLIHFVRDFIARKIVGSHQDTNDSPTDPLTNQVMIELEAGHSNAV